MTEPPLAVWERSEALRTLEALRRDLLRIGSRAAWRRLERLTSGQRRLIYREIAQGALRD